MVKRYPSKKEDLSLKHENVSLAEIKFYNISEGLREGWFLWYSINWDKRSSIQSGEADYVLFHPDFGYAVIEVKGGIIEVEGDLFFSTSHDTKKRHKLSRSPFEQAKNSMYYILDYYVNKAKKQSNVNELLKDNKYFPLSFCYGVFFPDCYFKNNFESLQYPFRLIFDKKDYLEQLDWVKSARSGKSPLEQFLIDLLDEYKRLRKIFPGTADFFQNIMGSNIKHYVNLQHDLSFREKELRRVNQVQDFLLNALSYKKHCIFRGSAGSGKTYIGMKKALMSYQNGKRVLFICFNTELREFIRSYIAEQLKVSYKAIQDRISVYSINLLLSKLISKLLTDGGNKTKARNRLSNFQYDDLIDILKPNLDDMPNEFKYETLIVDEAQDIEKEVWDLFPHLLYYPEDSVYYVFYDEAQSIFIDQFSPKDFHLDPKRDMINLTQNLRNTQEIAQFLEKRTSYEDFQVNYDQYSGIGGLKISKKLVKDAPTALMNIASHIKNKYYNNEVDHEHVIILSRNKLKTIMGKNAKEESQCCYIAFKDKNQVSSQKIYMVEPDSVNDIPEIRNNPKKDKLIVFKTISSFKGLERDIVYLLIPKIKDFKKKHEWKYKTFIKQVYVGASRAKFKLYVFEYRI